MKANESKEKGKGRGKEREEERKKGNWKLIFHYETWQRSFKGDWKGTNGEVGIKESLSFIQGPLLLNICFSA